MVLTVRGTVGINAVANGTSLLPSHTFSNALGTGMYLASTNTLGFSVSGVNVMNVISNGTVVIPGTLVVGNLGGTALGTINASSISLGTLNSNVLPSEIGNSTTTFIGNSFALANGSAISTFAASGANVTLTLPWVAAVAIPPNPIAPTSGLDITTLVQSPGTLTAWGSATVSTTPAPTFTQYTPEPADSFVTLSGSAFVDLETSTWNVSSAVGFTFVGSLMLATGAGTVFSIGGIALSKSGNVLTFSVDSFSVSAPFGPDAWVRIATRVHKTSTNAWDISLWINEFETKVSVTGTILDRTSTPRISNATVRELAFYNSPLTVGQVVSVSKYMYTKYGQLYLKSQERSLALVSNAVQVFKITNSGEMTARSINGMVVKGPQSWSTPNLLRLEILGDLQASRDSCCVMPGIDGSRTGASVQKGYFGGVLLPDGRVFMVPSNATSAALFDPASDTLIMANVSTSFGSGFTSYMGGVLLHDGKVFCIPASSATARIYDPVNNTVSIPGGNYAGTSLAYRGGVLMNDGNVFIVPYNATSAKIYNPSTDSLTTPSGTYAGNGAFSGAVLLADGRVFLVPHNSTTARIYDPSTDTLSTPGGTYPGSFGFQGGVLLPDGRVFCVPYASNFARIYDPVSNTVIIPNAEFPIIPGTTGSYSGGVLLPDGRVFCVPRGPTARIYDPVRDIVTAPRGTYPTSSLGGYHGGVLVPDGRVVCVPWDVTNIRIAHCGGWGTQRLPQQVLLSPFLNKF